MTNSARFLRALLLLVIFSVLFAGCRNNPPAISHNQSSDTISIAHGNSLNLEFRFRDDRDQLDSALVMLDDEELYSGSDSIYVHRLNTSGMKAGGYIYTLIAEDADQQVTEKTVLLNIRGVAPDLAGFEVSGAGATYIDAAFEIISDGGIEISEKGILYSDAGGAEEKENEVILDDTRYMTDGIIDGFPRDRELRLRAYAKNRAGTGYSDYLNIKTKDGIPLVRTGDVRNIRSVTAHAGGQLVTNGGEKLIAYGICYSENTEPAIDDFVSYASGNSNYRVELDELIPFTKYYYRSFARNRFATTYGRVSEFETSGPPTVKTGEPGRIMVTSVRMNIEVVDDGGHEVTEAGVCYSMLKNPGIDGNVSAFGKGTGTFEDVIAYLDPGSKYYFRAYAVNSEGVSYGDEIKISTKLGIPEVVTAGVKDIDYSSVTVTGDLKDDGGLDVIERGIVWDTAAGPTKQNNYAIIEGGNGKFDYRIEGLETGRKYYTRAYARNEKGYVYADALEFVPLIKTDMAEVKGGSFLMGDEKADDMAQPVHEVRLDSYSIGKYEVSNEEFAIFLNSHIDNIVFEGDSDIVVLNTHPVYFLKVYGEDYNKTGFRVHIYYENGRFKVIEGAESFPAILVTWEGARMFCEWAGGRLPTEAEWEFAARGGSNSSYTWSGGDDLDELGWYYRNSKGAMCELMPNGRGLYKRGQLKPNSLGIYDMSGNVSEWCNDIFDADYYAVSPVENPMGPAKGSSRVIRGGSWADRDDNCTVYTRIKSFDLKRGYDNIGFRLVRPVKD
ncbi:MAG: SUMF1/EgtB/PvdO family nonheme iron enzyme [Bacteroidales bacterium]|nr:SUMF1/EgtB/PvdO family nonheme iron enzyme [Bacteroidales bacterium]